VSNSSALCEPTWGGNGNEPVLVTAEVPDFSVEVGGFNPAIKILAKDTSYEPFDKLCCEHAIPLNFKSIDRTFACNFPDSQVAMKFSYDAVLEQLDLLRGRSFAFSFFTLVAHYRFSRLDVSDTMLEPLPRAKDRFSDLL